MASKLEGSVILGLRRSRSDSLGTGGASNGTPYCWERERAVSLRWASVGSVSSMPHAQKLFLAIAADLRIRHQAGFIYQEDYNNQSV